MRIASSSAKPGLPATIFQNRIDSRRERTDERTKLKAVPVGFVFPNPFANPNWVRISSYRKTTQSRVGQAFSLPGLPPKFNVDLETRATLAPKGTVPRRLGSFF
jgi:hypothetical protein